MKAPWWYIWGRLKALMPPHFGHDLEGDAGMQTTTRPCGCYVTAVHDPERRLWIFTCDYSKCRFYKRAKKDYV